MVMKSLIILTLGLASTMAYALMPLKDEKIIELAKVSMEKHLQEEGLTIDDAKVALAFKDKFDKATIYFEVDEHHGDSEIYVVICRDNKCYLNYR
jgi:hypothetical protein